MKKQNRKDLFAAMVFFAAFLLWTALVRFVDVQSIGPQSTTIGLASVNGFVRDLIGVQMQLYTVTDWLGLIPIAFMFGFAILGLTQWIKRKRLSAVDRRILALGILYAAVFAAYLLFERFTVNFRPILIDGRLEASYPSSTTLLVLTVMPTAAMQFRSRRWVGLLHLFSFLMVAGRLLSGVHWLTDIIGGILLSISLVKAYSAAVK